MARRIAWGPTLRRWLSWALLASFVSVADAEPRKAPDRDRQAERRKEAERRRAERRRAEREKRIQECIDDRDTDPDADREICESETD